MIPSRVCSKNPGGFAPADPLRAHSRGPHDPRSVRAARSRSSLATHVLVIAACALAIACDNTSAPPQPPSSKQRVSKRDAAEFAPKPAIDRSRKKMADNKPGDGRVALVKATAPPPIAISAERPVNGTLSRSDVRLDDGSYVDYYTYAGTRGEQLTITLRSTAFDAYLAIGAIRFGIFDADDEDDDSGGNTDARLDVIVGATGPLVIAANTVEANETGPYVLEVKSSRSAAAPASTGRGGGSAADVGDLPVNTPVGGRLEQGDRQMSRDKSYYDYWMFDGRAGQRVTITMRSDALDSYLILKVGTPSRGETIAEDDDGGGGVHARITATLPENGPYTIVANSAAAASGAYTLTLETAGGGGRGSAPNAGSSSASAAAVPYADRYPGTGDPNDKYALVVGIADYPGTEHDLTGTVNDARIFRDLLVNKFGFKPANIVMLTDASATRDHILNAFVRHLGQAGPQGTAVFYYSGHGTQMQNNLALTAPLDPEADGRDEALYVWGTDEASSYILDDEIGYLIDQLKTDKVLLIHDSCHSGTSSKGGTTGGQSKEIIFTKEVAAASYTPLHFSVDAKSATQSPAGQGQTLGQVLETKRPYGLLAGSKDDELSWTAGGWPDKGGQASVFTYYLVSTLESTDEGATFADVMKKVEALTSAYTLKTYKERQTPQLGGTIGSRTIASILR